MFAKKTLAQHFLRNPRILERIVAAAKLASTDTVLEVGPGEGTLTALLLQKAARVIAVEKDARLIPLLRHTFAAQITAGKLELIYADILEPTTDYRLPTTGYKVIANLPYYITGQFLRRSLQAEQQPSSMTLLLQKEVARRIVGADGKESLLSISVKCYGKPRYVATVKAGSFSPPPKVDSAIIAIQNISKGFFESRVSYSSFLKGGARRAEDLEIPPPMQHRSAPFRKGRINEKDFFALLKNGFAHPRKLLSSNLGVAPHMLERCGIPPKSRAENLSLADWKTLAQQIPIPP